MPKATRKPPRQVTRNKGLIKVKVRDLAVHDSNFRVHTPEQRKALGEVVTRLGWYGYPDVFRNEAGQLQLIDGHLRREYLLDKFGEDAEVEVNLTDMNPEEAKLALATHDPLSAMAGVDDDILSGLLSDIGPQTDALQGMLDGLSGADVDVGGPAPARTVVEDVIPEPPVTPRTKPGDLWVLGKHRLLCADCEDPKNIQRLTRGAKASLVFTDPPYGINYQSNMARRKKAVLENDDKILTDWIGLAAAASEGFVFVWTAWKVVARWMVPLSTFGTLTNMVIWDKGGGGMGDLQGAFATDYEIALVYNRGAKLTGKRIGSVWSINKDGGAQYRHPTQKPVGLAAHAISHTTEEGAIVMDFFLGAGSTLIACEQLGRTCLGLEISPAFCDVIVDRWEALTGKKAVCRGVKTSSRAD